MYTVKSKIHSAVSYLCAFCSFIFRKEKPLRRAICLLCAIVILFSVIPPSYAINSDESPDKTAEESVTATESTDALLKQSFELYPNGEAARQVITLDGMMPEGAAAEAIDVIEQRSSSPSPLGNGEQASVIAAYDITITVGDDEFQPVEEHPIYVEIMDPAISAGDTLELWHVIDHDRREKIEQLIITDGKVSFWATGFSIYEIVDLYSGETTELVSDVSELTAEPGASTGFYLYYTDANGTDHYFTSTLNGSSALVETEDILQAAIWKFEQSDDNLLLSTVVNGTKKYLHTKSGKTAEIELSSTGDPLQISPSPTELKYFIKHANANKWIQHSNGGKGIRYYTQNDSSDYNPRIAFQYAHPVTDQAIIDQLNGNSFGLFHYADKSTLGNALMADGEAHSLIKLVLTAEDNGRVLYVDENHEIDQWTFTYDSSVDKFYISKTSGGETLYLRADNNGLSTVNSIANASEFSATVSNGSHVQLNADGYYLTFEPRTEENGGGRFTVTQNTTDSNTWLYLLNSAVLQDHDYITFTADRLSVSDLQDGQRVIVYVRIWNEQELRYDMYAVDRDGTLYPCYASGGKIMWLGDGDGTLEWEFTAYLDPYTHEPNHYYELYNQYSEKYLAPQLTGDQVLSEDTIGLNMPGRRNGEFFSNIIAWDNSRYAYIGLRPNADKTALEPCAESVALPFYFATQEDLNLRDRLHTVPTIDNAQYGITMKMVNFDLRDDKDYGTANGAQITLDYFDNDGSNKLKKNLLSRFLKENGYPNTMPNSKNKDLGEVYANAIDVNHLFLERVYESSGYFEFDSAQNFATLKKTDEYGNAILDSNGKTIFNTNEDGVTDFTLFYELGTHEQKEAHSMQHGQFFPYDTISPDIFPTKWNQQNLYSSLTSPNKDNTMGLLPDDDPRKYEPLHLIQTEEEEFADFYFGMEMEASFVQTPSGLDAWGHDIIFEFTGDDDFWLYVDDQLVLDLGGIHSAAMGTINFRTGDVYYEKNGASVHGTMGHTTLRQLFTDNYRSLHPSATTAEINEYLNTIFAPGENCFKDYSTHKMKVFYMERGAGASNLHMRFNIASVTPGHVVVNKTISGEGADELDTDFIEYPFQIYYTLPEGDEQDHWILLGNDDQHIGVTYQNSNQPATFVRSYRPPGFTTEQAYQNIYFINPTKSAEIAFPDNTIRYKIVECAVDSTVYERVTINGEPVPEENIVKIGDLRSYSSNAVSADERPSISFDNFVKDNVIKDLFVTKKLIDENDNLITNDPATFDFKLSLSSVDVPADQIPFAYLYRYYVLSPDHKMCRFDSTLHTFVETALDYSQETARQLKQGPINGVTAEDVTFTTSPFGTISGIPSGYTFCVPGLPVGSLFKVTENAKVGYGLADPGYVRVMGTKTDVEYHEEDIPSYWEYDSNTPINTGRVRGEENPQMEVRNKKGYGLQVSKQWSDVALTSAHQDIYTAVYVKEPNGDGTYREELLQDSVKRILSSSPQANYFWTTLKPYPNGSERTDLSDYIIKEVTISSASPTIAADGTVTNYGTVTPLSSGSSINLTATRIPAATPAGEQPAKNYNYIVSYDVGEDNGSTRVDTITNTREGGIALRLFKWNTDPTVADIPLRGGKFLLTDQNGDTVGEYYSSSDGLITMMYEFERNQIYTLEQEAAPRGYVGLQKKLCFKINNDDTVSLFYDDGTSVWGTGEDNEDDLHWANSKQGANGLFAYIDVYNKPFNFRLEKMDSENPNQMLQSAHFALFKQANTSISGHVKNKDPLNGFEDMVTDENGVIYICGGGSGRTLNPGSTGSMYFLTETFAPPHYAVMEEDIVFHISPLGVPSLISDSYHGLLVEEEDSYIYTLSVPNTYSTADDAVLTITKTVSGTFSDLTKPFTFTISSESDDPHATFEWTKNGVIQNHVLHTGSTFTLKHNESVTITVPVDAVISITEDSEDYIATFKLGDAASEETNIMTFSISEDTTLAVTNTLDGIIPLGVFTDFMPALLLLVISAVGVLYVMYRRRTNG